MRMLYSHQSRYLGFTSGITAAINQPVDVIDFINNTRAVISGIQILFCHRCLCSLHTGHVHIQMNLFRSPHEIDLFFCLKKARLLVLYVARHINHFISSRSLVRKQCHSRSIDDGVFLFLRIWWQHPSIFLCFCFLFFLVEKLGCEFIRLTANDLESINCAVR